MILTTTPVTVWVFEAYNNVSSVPEILFANPNLNSITLLNLDPGVIYTIRVAGVNTRGIGNFSEFATDQKYYNNKYLIC